MIATPPSPSPANGSFEIGATFSSFSRPARCSLPCRPAPGRLTRLDEVLANPKDALDVMDFEAAARKALPPAHWGYMASGVDDNLTRDANHEAYKRIQLRPRKLVDVSKIDTRVELFGTTWDSPIFLCPVGGQGMFHAGRRAGHGSRRSSQEELCRFSRRSLRTASKT